MGSKGMIGAPSRAGTPKVMPRPANQVIARSRMSVSMAASPRAAARVRAYAGRGAPEAVTHSSAPTGSGGQAGPGVAIIPSPYGRAGGPGYGRHAPAGPGSSWAGGAGAGARDGRTTEAAVDADRATRRRASCGRSTAVRPVVARPAAARLPATAADPFAVAPVTHHTSGFVPALMVLGGVALALLVSRLGARREGQG